MLAAVQLLVTLAAAALVGEASTNPTGEVPSMLGALAPPWRDSSRTRRKPESRMTPIEKLVLQQSRKHQLLCTNRARSMELSQAAKKREKEEKEIQDAIAAGKALRLNRIEKFKPTRKPPIPPPDPKRLPSPPGPPAPEQEGTWRYDEAVFLLPLHHS